MTPQARLCAIIEQQLCTDPVTAENMADAEFLSTTSFDSLDMVELVMNIEEEFHVEITDDEAEQFAPNDLGTTRPLCELVALIEGRSG